MTRFALFVFSFVILAFGAHGYCSQVDEIIVSQSNVDLLPKVEAMIIQKIERLEGDKNPEYWLSLEYTDADLKEYGGLQGLREQGLYDIVDHVRENISVDEEYFASVKEGGIYEFSKEGMKINTKSHFYEKARDEAFAKKIWAALYYVVFVVGFILITIVLGGAY